MNWHPQSREWNIQTHRWRYPVRVERQSQERRPCRILIPLPPSLCASLHTHDMYVPSRELMTCTSPPETFCMDSAASWTIYIAFFCLVLLLSPPPIPFSCFFFNIAVCFRFFGHWENNLLVLIFFFYRTCRCLSYSSHQSLSIFFVFWSIHFVEYLWYPSPHERVRQRK
jgi:hypothetical protein